MRVPSLGVLESNMSVKMVLAGAVLALTAGSAVATELLVNGGFDTGDLSWWSVTNDQGATFVVSTFAYGPPPAGTYYVYSGQQGSPIVLSQTFADTAGQTLTVSGWAIGDPQTPSPPNGLIPTPCVNPASCTDGSGIVTFSFDGGSLGAIAPPAVWTQYSFTVTATGSDTFSVGIQNDPSNTGVGSFSVTSSTVTVPGPIAGAGFPGIFCAAFGFLLWRRNQYKGRATLVKLNGF